MHSLTHSFNSLRSCNTARGSQHPLQGMTMSKHGRGGSRSHLFQFLLGIDRCEFLGIAARGNYRLRWWGTTPTSQASEREVARLRGHSWKVERLEHRAGLRGCGVGEGVVVGDVTSRGDDILDHRPAREHPMRPSPHSHTRARQWKARQCI